MDPRSGCPINLSIEIVGDRWTMIVLRDIMFGDRRTYRTLLQNSLEGIASNILANRLKKLMDEDMLTKAPDPTHSQRSIYSLTEKSISLVPTIVQLAGWGRRFLPASHALSVRARVLEEGGPAMWADFMAELRHRHLGTPYRGDQPTPTQQLQAAYQAALDDDTDR